jgi:hypothetical protein
LAEVGGFIANRFAADQRRFSSKATHSTWWVIGKTSIVVSVNAIHCGRLRAWAERGRDLRRCRFDARWRWRPSAGDC